MPFNSSTFRVMIASPGDVERERKIAREVIHEWNDIHSADKNIVLLPVGWESHSYSAMGERPQSIINKQILMNCDLLIGIFWTRIGTPTGNSESGTVEEIEEHISAGKQAMIYFSKSKVNFDSVDKKQYEKLCKFKDKCEENGLIEFYKSKPDFRKKLTRQLALLINHKNNFFINKLWKI